MVSISGCSDVSDADGMTAQDAIPELLKIFQSIDKAPRQTLCGRGLGKIWVKLK